MGISGELPEPLCNHYDLSGPSAGLDPTNPDHVYQEADDWMKSDDELSYREFEQKYHYDYGYCDDFSKVHNAVSDRTQERTRHCASDLKEIWRINYNDEALGCRFESAPQGYFH